MMAVRRSVMSRIVYLPPMSRHKLMHHRTLSAYARAVAGAVVMVIVLLVLFPVAVLVGSGILAAALGSFLKADSDASNCTDDGPNEYLELARNEAETGYPRPV